MLGKLCSVQIARMRTDPLTAFCLQISYLSVDGFWMPFFKTWWLTWSRRSDGLFGNLVPHFFVWNRQLVSPLILLDNGHFQVSSLFCPCVFVKRSDDLISTYCFFEYPLDFFILVIGKQFNLNWSTHWANSICVANWKISMTRALICRSDKKMWS